MARNIYVTTWSDVDVTVYTKRYGDQPESGNNMTASGTVYYLVDWPNRWRFIRTVMGTPQAQDYASPTSLLYRLPLQYADNPALYATSFDVTPVGVTNNCASPWAPEVAYQYAWVGIQYGTLPYNPVTLYTVETRTASQEITAPNYSYKFASDNLLIDQPFAVNVANQTIQVTFHRVPSFDSSGYVGYQNTVNASQFLGYAAGTLLFNPLVSRYSSGIGTGSPVYEVVVSMTWRSVEWNKSLRPDGSWDSVVDTGGGNPPFASSEFNNLT